MQARKYVEYESSQTHEHIKQPRTHARQSREHATTQALPARNLVDSLIVFPNIITWFYQIFFFRR